MDDVLHGLPECTCTREEGIAAERASDESACRYGRAVIACARGEHDEIAIIYSTERRKLREAVRRLLPRREWADDILHDAFVQIIRDAASFDPARGSARAWIYTILRNTALKHCRNTRREVDLADTKIQSIRESEEAPTSCEQHVESYRALRSCLDQMDPRRRATLLLSIIDGRTHTEIAACLGVSLGTVKAWIRRDLIALRKALQ